MNLVAPLLTVFGSLVAFVGVLGGAAEAALARRAGVSMLVLAVALGAFVGASPEGPVKPTIVAPGYAADGTPAVTTVTFQEPDGGRSVRRVPLERALPVAAPVLWAAAGLALLLALLAARKLSTGLERVGVVGLVALCALAGLVLSGGAGGLAAEGEAGVRAALAALPTGSLGTVASFTVPETSWAYVAGAPLPLYLGATVALLAGFLPLGGRTGLGGALGPGAALCAVAVAADVFLTQGFAWRGGTGLLWGAALLSLVAAVDRASPRRAGSLAGAAVGLALLALPV